MNTRDRIVHALLLLASFALFGLWCSKAHAQESPTLTFTLETSSTDGKAVTPRLTWSTTPATSSCTASGATDWTGAKPAAGTAVLAPVTTSRSYALACTWPGVSTATINWDAPTTNTDGSPYSNPGGFRIQYGMSSSAGGGASSTTLDQSAYVQNPAARTWTSPTLAAGTWSFGVRAFNTLGLESEISNWGTKTLTAAASQARTLELTIKFPAAPVLK